jgi:hypothetical protein
MTTLFSLGAPIGPWMRAIHVAQNAQKTRFHDVPVVKEWSPANSDWLFPLEDDAIALKRARFERWASLCSDARDPPVSHNLVVEWATAEDA